jgi:hypothetical protein
MAAFAGETIAPQLQDETEQEERVSETINIKELTLASLRIEVERALEEDDNETAALLKDQIKSLEADQASEDFGDSEHANKVIEGLYIGDITAAVDTGIVSRAGFTHVVDLANTICAHHHLYGNEKNVHYEIPKETGDWSENHPSILAKFIVRVKFLFLFFLFFLFTCFCFFS